MCIYSCILYLGLNLSLEYFWTWFIHKHSFDVHLITIAWQTWLFALHSIWNSSSTWHSPYGPYSPCQVSHVLWYWWLTACSYTILYTACGLVCSMLLTAGWFTGLSQNFLSCPVPKILILAGTYVHMYTCAQCCMERDSDRSCESPIVLMYSSTTPRALVLTLCRNPLLPHPLRYSSITVLRALNLSIIVI